MGQGDHLAGHSPWLAAASVVLMPSSLITRDNVKDYKGRSSPAHPPPSRRQSSAPMPESIGTTSIP